ncbi:sensor histidine kinase [Nocardiopsis listeri]|uniref:sensor histidine kinase n=1 Tax=Nocardiopsis listeri TaxID=53440 RepID=UPI0008328B4B|nr:histidine kinase [Nocardiopsis listeri]
MDRSATHRFDHLLDGLGLRGDTRRDIALGLLVGAVSVAVLWVSLPALESLEGVVLARGTIVSSGLVLLAQALPLGLRRQNPVLSLVGVAALQVLLASLTPAGFNFHGPALFIAAYTCGTVLSLSRLSVVLVACALVYGAAEGLLTGALAPAAGLSPVLPGEPPSWVTAPILTVPALLVPGLIGIYVGTHRRYAELVRLRDAEEIQAHKERAQTAIRAERTRMARELHDIAAHHLSGMVVQAGAAERLIGRDDEAARHAMVWVRTQGKETLTGLRAVVGALRDPDEEETRPGHDTEARDAPVPGLAAVERLVSTERELGTDLRLVREGSPYELPPIADVTAYRAVQEALSNARDHAAGANVSVRLWYRPERFALEVENEAGGARDVDRNGRGLGVLGMRERAGVVGARLDVGPTDRGGWRVRWEIPVEREETR